MLACDKWKNKYFSSYSMSFFSILVQVKQKIWHDHVIDNLLT